MPGGAGQNAKIPRGAAARSHAMRTRRVGAGVFDRHAACSSTISMPDQAPHVIAGRYRLGRVLGAGGMGTVYCASDLVGGGDVAVKVIHPERAHDPMIVGYLRAEAKHGSRVRHPNVVTVRDSDASDDPFVVMELVEGRSLGELLEQTGPLPVQRASSIARQILAGLAAIHDAGYVHGDVKSHNVLVERIGERDAVTLIDLGLMRRLASAPPTGSGYASGTPDYMAPEVIRGETTCAASDLYAVGILLYELLTGATPFAGGSSIEILNRQLHDEVVPVGLRCNGRVMPAAFERAVMRALEKSPGARYASATVFASALRAATPLAEPPCASDLPHAGFSTTAPTMTWPAEPPVPPARLAAGTRPPRRRK